ncbi:MAG: hypothetical protein HY537_07805 [Deltaproteobacteria bacterium]|nr:hypothetical protein [Deltaproteobacteria bacterium]
MMKAIVIMGAVALLMVGCGSEKGQQGAPGPQGPVGSQGLPGPGPVVTGVTPLPGEVSANRISLRKGLQAKEAGYKARVRKVANVERHLPNLSDLKENENCVQLVELPKKTVAVFSAGACPEGRATATNIVLNLDYDRAEVDGGNLRWPDTDLVVGQLRTTAFTRGRDTETITEITSLCDEDLSDKDPSDKALKLSQKRCRVEVKDGRLVGITRLIKNVWLGEEVRRELGMDENYPAHASVQLVKFLHHVRSDGEPNKANTVETNWIEFSDHPTPPEGGIQRGLSRLNVLLTPFDVVPSDTLSPTRDPGTTGELHFNRTDNAGLIGNILTPTFGERNPTVDASGKRKIAALDWRFWTEGAVNVPVDEQNRRQLLEIHRLGTTNFFRETYSSFRIDMMDSLDVPLPGKRTFEGVSSNAGADVVIPKELNDKFRATATNPLPGRTPSKPINISNNCAFFEERFTGEQLGTNKLLTDKWITLFGRPCPTDGRKAALEKNEISRPHRGFFRAPNGAKEKAAVQLKLRGEQYLVFPSAAGDILVGRYECKEKKTTGFPPYGGVSRECAILDLCTRHTVHPDPTPVWDSWQYCAVAANDSPDPAAVTGGEITNILDQKTGSPLRK